MNGKFEILEQLAAQIMLSGIKENILLEKWEYRKGKTFADVRHAVGKGRMKGIGKFETECMEIAFALDSVIKKRKE